MLLFLSQVSVKVIVFQYPKFTQMLYFSLFQPAWFGCFISDVGIVRRALHMLCSFWWIPPLAPVCFFHVPPCVSLIWDGPYSLPPHNPSTKAMLNSDVDMHPWDLPAFSLEELTGSRQFLNPPNQVHVSTFPVGLWKLLAENFVSYKIKTP